MTETTDRAVPQQNDVSAGQTENPANGLVGSPETLRVPRQAGSFETTEVLIEIQGRAALPVNVIPFVTVWSIPPDKLALLMAHQHPNGWDCGFDGETPELTAFKQDESGELLAVVPKEWDQVIIELKGLSSRISGSELDRDDGLTQWRAEAWKALPPEWFVWKDEFETCAPQAMLKDLGRPGAKDLVYAPRLPTEAAHAIRAKFPKVTMPVDDIATPTAVFSNQARRPGELVEAAIKGLNKVLRETTIKDVMCWLRTTDQAKALGLSQKDGKLQFADQDGSVKDLTQKMARDALNNRKKKARKSA
jgi:hypothetical protein